LFFDCSYINGLTVLHKQGLIIRRWESRMSHFADLLCRPLDRWARSAPQTTNFLPGPFRTIP